MYVDGRDRVLGWGEREKAAELMEVAPDNETSV